MYGYPNYVIWGKIIFIGHNYHELVRKSIFLHKSLLTANTVNIYDICHT